MVKAVVPYTQFAQLDFRVGLVLEAQKVKIADKLIRMSGDSHHIFIENFNEDMKNPDHYELSTGS